MGPNPQGTAPETPPGAFSPRRVALYLAAYVRRLESEGRAIHDPSDRADHREHLDDVREQLAAVERLWPTTPTIVPEVPTAGTWPPVTSCGRCASRTRCHQCTAPTVPTGEVPR